MDSDILEKVKTYLIEASDAEIDLDAIKATTSLRDDLDLDSLQSLTMIMDLEEHYGMSVDEDELVDLETVGDVVELIVSKKAHADS